MRNIRCTGVLPTHAEFAFRLFNCLNKVCGRLSAAEFNEWFSLCTKKAKTGFRRTAFRSYVAWHLSPRGDESTEQRWARASLEARKKFIRNARATLCDSWQSAYGMYGEVSRLGFAKSQFESWWTMLRESERLLVLDQWHEQLTQDGYEVWLSELTENARITIRRRHGTDCELPQVF